MKAPQRVRELSAAQHDCLDTASAHAAMREATRRVTSQVGQAGARDILRPALQAPGNDSGSLGFLVQAKPRQDCRRGDSR